MKQSRVKLKSFFLAHRLPAVVVAGLLIGAVSYGIWSKLAWDGYEREYKNWHAEIKQQLDQAFEIPGKQHDRKLQALAAVSDGIGKRQNAICNTGILIDWQGFISTLSKRKEACEGVRDQLNALGDRLSVFVAYMADEQALAVILKAVPAKTELPDNEWEAQAEAWKGVSAKVALMKVSVEFKSTRQKAKEVTDQIGVSWQTVIAAHKAKDKAKYLQAQARLVQAYGLIGDISDVSMERTQKLADSITSARASY